MVMTPGGYVFTDYVKFGVPLNVLAMTLTVVISYFAFPFPSSASNTVAANVAAYPELSTLYVALNSQPMQGLWAQLNNQTARLTLFGPSNLAFDAYGPLPGYEALIPVVEYAIVTDAVATTDLARYDVLRTSLTDPAWVHLGDGVGQVVAVDVDGDGNVRLASGVPGDPATTATVTRRDIASYNGYLDIVGTVLPPPAPLLTVAERAGLTTLLEALGQVGLDVTLNDTPAITLFAPTNDAFAAVPDWRERADLEVLMRYHVAEGAYYAPDLTDGAVLPSYLGGGAYLTVNVTETGALTLNSGSTTVTVRNALTENGVIHIIDRLLLEPLPSSGSIAL